MLAMCRYCSARLEIQAQLGTNPGGERDSVVLIASDDSRGWGFDKTGSLCCPICLTNKNPRPRVPTKAEQVLLEEALALARALTN